MNLLICNVIEFSQDQINSLKNFGYNISFHQDEKSPFGGDPKEIDGIICNAFFLHHDIALYKNLKFIQVTSAGLDRLPLDYIHSHSIKLFNAGNVYSIPIAEWVILKILEIYKHSSFFIQNQLHQKWEKRRDIQELSDKTALIIGCGYNGCEIAKRLNAFNVHTVGIDIQEISRERKRYFDEIITTNDFSEQLKIADIIILTLPLTNDTFHIINDHSLNLMKQDAVLINISRGAIIDESSLIQTLQRSKLYGVALDVFEQEPLSKDNPLWSFPNVTITPHNSYCSTNNEIKLQELIIQNLMNITNHDSTNS